MTTSEVAHFRRRSGHDPIADPVPGIVEDSWRRCFENYNLTPDVIPRVALLTRHEFQDTLGRHEDLIQVALTEVEKLFLQMVDNEYMVSMASPEGVNLVFRCDHQFLAEMSDYRVLPGAIWSEERQGTNGIGTCIKTGRPLSIIGDQHFDQSISKLSCTVAPIFGASGAIESVLNVTSSRPVTEPMARIVCDIVERAARRIENRYFARRNAKLRTVCLSPENDFADIQVEARIAVDENWRIIDVSSTVPRVMRQSRESIIGMELPSLIDSVKSLEDGTVTVTELAQGGQPLYAKMLPSARVQPRGATVKVERPIALPTLTPRSTETDLAGNLLVDPQLLEQLDLATRMVSARIPILIHGETGVGKTSFVQLLARGQRDIVTVNCMALEGFGNEVFDRLFSLKDFTLVLDHVDEMPASEQARLLHYLSEDTVLAQRNVDLISLASRDPGEMIAGGAFRYDLYQRLKGTVLELQPLRLAPKLHAHIDKVFGDEAASLGRGKLAIDDEARLILRNYHWPGNLRELRQTARHAAVLTLDGAIKVSSLPQQIVSQIARSNLSARSQSEASRIEAALRHNAGNVSETARYLGISRATLYRKIEIQKARITK